MIKTLTHPDFGIQTEDFNFEYQNQLTPRLDHYSGDFNQDVINEIVLWKVNRYAELSEETLALLNEISTEATPIDEVLTRELLTQLLNTRGIQLAMASTILRFRNSKVYQIIDQRVYRLIYGIEYKPEKSIGQQIDGYLKYLNDLHIEADRLQFPFELADRILYKVDKRLNQTEKLKNYE